jgi:putative transposase
MQCALDQWRTVYNLDRPHQALGQEVPASRYRPSPRAMPDRLPVVEYDDHEIVRRVGTTKAYVSFKGRLWKVPEAFCGEQLAIRPQHTDGQYNVCFGAHPVATIDLTQPKSFGDISGQVSGMSSG